MNKTVFWISFLTAFILVGGFFALHSYIYHQKQGEVRAQVQRVTYICTESKRLEVMYGEAGRAATLVLPDGEAYLLARSESDIGERYVTADESVVLHMQSGEVSVVLDGEVRYKECTRSN